MNDDPAISKHLLLNYKIDSIRTKTTVEEHLLYYIVALLLLQNDWSEGPQPQDGKEQVVKPRDIESDKLPVIFTTNTSAHPYTVMVVAGNANIAVGTVCSIRRLVDIAKIAPSPLT